MTYSTFTNRDSGPADIWLHFNVHNILIQGRRVIVRRRMLHSWTTCGSRLSPMRRARRRCAGGIR